MISIRESFLRPPTTTGERTADALRVATVISVIVAAAGWGFVELAVFMLALLGALVPRALRVRVPLDIAMGLTCLVSAWSNVFDLYTTLLGWDKLIHFVLTGVIAALVVVVAQHTAFLPPLKGHRLGHVLVATLLGLGLGGLWEIGEWAGHTFVDSGVFVSYVDTIGDLGADGAGALLAGLLLPRLFGNSSTESPAPTEGRGRPLSHVTIR